VNLLTCPRTLFGSTLLLVFCCTAFAQQKAAPLPATPPDENSKDTLRVSTQRVLLDVVVTDSRGNPVRNLTKDDFQVYEDHVPQVIKSFEATESRPLPSNVPINSTAELDKIEPKAPVSILVLDELATKFEDQAFTRYSLKKYLKSQGNTLAQPTMLVVVNFKHFMVLRDYTTSKQEILKALDQHMSTMVWTPGSGNLQASQFTATFASLMEVAEATAGHPGHKNMIWVGRGFPSMDLATLDPVSMDAIQQMIQLCTNMLRDARITLYTVDPVGLTATAVSTLDDDFSDEDPFDSEVGFKALAKATGGMSFYNRNDVDNMIGKSFDAGTNFYTLSYRPTSGSTDAKAFRNIHIVMKDKALHATTRKGYYNQQPTVAPVNTADGKMSNSVAFDLTLAMQSMMVYDEIPFTVTRSTTDSDSFLLRLDSSLIPESGTGPADFIVFVESFDQKGKLLNRIAYTATGNTATSGAAPTKYLSISTHIETAPPAARLRFVLRLNNTGKLGAENFYLVDPSTSTDPMGGRTLHHNKN
jgi:VWFA-related protein